MPSSRWYPAILLAGLPAIVAVFISQRAAIQLSLLMVASIAIKLTAIAIPLHPPSFRLLEAIVRNPSAMGYFTDAQALRAAGGNYLAIYPQLLPLTHLHTQSKPPGAIVYFDTCLRLFLDSGRAAIAGGIGLALFASFSIPAVYLLARSFNRSKSESQFAAMLIAFMPGFTLMFPAFDAIWPVLTSALLITWRAALSRNDNRWSALFGGLLFVATFCTYNLFVLGLLLIAMPLIFRVKFRTVVSHAVISLATFTAAYLVLWLITSFNPIATLIAAWQNQHVLLHRYADQRPYPATILFDLTDFMLGAGWIVALPILLRCLRRQVTIPEIVFLALPIAVAVSGLLQSETARVWTFMLPLIVIPAAAELCRYSLAARKIFVACMWVLLVVLGQNMVFISN